MSGYDNLPFKFKFSISTDNEDKKAVQNVENMVVWGNQGSFKIVRNCTV